MDISLFFAKYFGLYFLIIGLIGLSRRNQVEPAINHLFTHPGLMALSGISKLLFGLAIVLIHPIWEWDWRGVITFLGYLGIVAGIIRLSFPESMKTFDLKVFSNAYWFIWTIVLLLGIYFIYHGFFAIRQ
ncbi:hypothetical protein [Candidatus Protochlamydia phocaeensis]|uniref:hypothetical protein n=1 Tax=Candidatus Protochlamydia phocaeensis TaxID=1414722 RepID=UPI0008382745|nr:hypothetical protein [Candidatus Protochlamydia phocaeensis]